MADKKEVLAVLEKMKPCFCDSVQQTFETMVFLPATCDDPCDPLGQDTKSDISATIGLTGDYGSGILAVGFKKPLAETIFRSMMMMGEDDPVEAAELKDVVGELANMIAGGAKATLQNDGTNCSLGLPTVVIGDDHQLESPADASVAVIPVSTDKGSFYMKIAVA